MLIAIIVKHNKISTLMMIAITETILLIMNMVMAIPTTMVGLMAISALDSISNL